MAQADGTIIIDTEINADGMKAGSKEVEAAVRRMAASVNDLGTKAKASLNKQVDAFSKLNSEYAAQAKKVEELKKKVSEYGNQKIPTEEYREIQYQIEQARSKMDRLIDAQNKFRDMGGSQNSKTYKQYQYDIDQLANTIKYAEGELKDLEDTGKAFTFGSKTKEAAADMERLAAAERKLSDMNNRLGTSYSAIKGIVKEYEGSVIKSTREVGILESVMNGLRLAANAPISVFKAFGSVLNKLPGKFAAASINLVKKAVIGLGSAVKSALANLLRFTGKGILSGLKKISSGILGIHKSANKTSMSLGRMLGSSLLFSAAFMGISAMLRGMKEGLQNLAQYSSTTNNSISMLISSLETLKNSFASAFAPILNVVAPVLSGFINMMSRAITYVGMFVAALTGQKTYTKALGVQKDYAASLHETASGAQEAAEGTEEAAKAAEDYLSPLDDINRYTEQNTDTTGPSSGTGSPGTGSGAGEQGPLFEEIPIMSSIKGIADKIRSLIESEDFEGLGAYIAEGINKGLAKIKKAISWENIGPEITYFVNAFTTTFNSLVDNLDWDLLGRTIGEGINTIVNTLNLLITGIDWKKLGDKFAEGFNGLIDEVDFWNLGTLLGNKMMILPQILLGFVKKLDWTLLGNQIAVGLNGMVNAINISVIAEALGTVINGIFQTAVEFSKTFDWTQLGTNIYEGINTFINTVDWDMVGQGLSDFVKGVLDILITIIQGIDWAEVVEAIETALANIDWIGIAGKICEFLGFALGVIVGALAKLIGDAIGNAALEAKKYFEEKVKEAGGNVILGILNGIKDAILGIGKWIYEHVFKPIIEGFKNAFGIHSPSTVMAEMGHYIIEGLLQGITDFIDRVKEAFNKIKEFIVGKFKETKDNVLEITETLKERLSYIFDLIKEKVFNVWEKIKEYIINPITNAKNKAVNTLSDMRNSFVNLLNDIKSRFSSAFNSLISIVKSPINWIIRMVNSLLGKVESAQHWIAQALSFSIDLPGWAQKLTGYSSFGISISKWNLPRLPYLASGAVIPPNKEFMAVLGDQKQGNNIEAPESLIRRIVREESGNSGGTFEFVAQLNRKVIFREVIEQAKLTRIQTGKNPFELE